jgi:hypothetical protein
MFDGRREWWNFNVRRWRNCSKGVRRSTTLLLEDSFLRKALVIVLWGSLKTEGWGSGQRGRNKARLYINCSWEGKKHT